MYRGSLTTLVIAGAFSVSCISDPIPGDILVEGSDFLPEDTWDEGVAAHRLLEEGEVVWCAVSRIFDGSFLDAALKVISQDDIAYTLEVYAKPAGFESYLREEGDPTWSFEFTHPGTDEDGESSTRIQSSRAKLTSTTPDKGF